MLWHKTIGAGGISKGLEVTTCVNVNDGSTSTPSVSLTSYDIEAGDIILTSITSKSTSDFSYTCTSPGYIELAELYANDTHDSNMAVYYKVADGTETTLAFSSSTFLHRISIVVVRGADTLSPIDVSITTATGINGTAETQPDVTTVTDEAGIILFCCASGSGANPLTTITQPTDTDNFAQAGGNTHRGAAATYIAGDAGSQATPDFGGGTTGDTTQTWICSTVAIRPNQQNASLWTPADITTELWYDSSDLTTLSLGATSGVQNTSVTQINDKSGNGNNLTSVTGSPTLVYGKYEGNNTINFTDDGFRERVSTLGISNNFSMLAMAAEDDPGSDSFDRIFSIKSSDESNDFDNLKSTLFRKTNAPLGVLAQCDTTTGSVQSVTDESLYMIESYCVSGGISQYFNGSETDNNFKTSVSISAEDIGLGQRYSNLSYWDGDICEVILIPTSSSSDRQKAEGYLAHKWGTADDLPSDHPYKSAPPTA